MHLQVSLPPAVTKKVQRGLGLCNWSTPVLEMLSSWLSRAKYLSRSEKMQPGRLPAQKNGVRVQAMQPKHATGEKLRLVQGIFAEPLLATRKRGV